MSSHRKSIPSEWRRESNLFAYKTGLAVHIFNTYLLSVCCAPNTNTAWIPAAHTSSVVVKIAELCGNRWQNKVINTECKN